MKCKHINTEIYFYITSPYLWDVGKMLLLYLFFFLLSCGFLYELFCCSFIIHVLKTHTHTHTHYIYIIYDFISSNFSTVDYVDRFFVHVSQYLIICIVNLTLIIIGASTVWVLTLSWG